MILLVGIYHLVIIFVGYWIQRKLFPFTGSRLTRLIVPIVIGLLFGIPVTYIAAVLTSFSNDPVSISLILYILGGSFFVFLNRKDFPNRRAIHGLLKKGITGIDVLVCFISIAVSWYIMTKTFKATPDGTLFVARNVVFDFGHAVSIIRSMSWGSNIPYSSPFVSGTEHLYHFMFFFWSAILERFGLPITYAVNIPSAFGFTLFLLTIYSIGKELFRSSVIGFLGVTFTILHGSLSFIPFFQKYGVSLSSIFRNPNYLFAGPFDGSIYSIFLTLNVFVNQRHLGLALSVLLFLYILFYQDVLQNKLNWKRVLLYAVAFSFFVLWHLTLAPALLFSWIVLLSIHKRWKQLFRLVILSVFVCLILTCRWFGPVINTILAVPTGGLASQTVQMSAKNILLWIVQFPFYNFGVLLPFLIGGLFIEKKTVQKIFPLLVLPALFFLLSLRTGAIDQKYLNVFMVFFVLFASSGIIALYRSGSIGKIIVVTLFPFLILSGVMDFMVIKNDYLFPVPNTEKTGAVLWITENTKKDAIFVSYRDIFDPVLLAGRRTYYGFFRQLYIVSLGSDAQRGKTVKDIYEATNAAELSVQVKKTGASYIIIPEKKQSEFTYMVSTDLLTNMYPPVYKDANLLILKIP
jgi:hypothetical protein